MKEIDNDIVHRLLNHWEYDMTRLAPQAANEIMRLAAQCTIESCVSGWQPIEKAPKDKSRILIFSESRGVREARFYRENEEGGEWYNEMVGGGPMTIFYDVTHWMPLPSAPNARIQGQENSEAV